MFRLDYSICKPTRTNSSRAGPPSSASGSLTHSHSPVPVLVSAAGMYTMRHEGTLRASWFDLASSHMWPVDTEVAESYACLDVSGHCSDSGRCASKCSTTSVIHRYFRSIGPHQQTH